MIINENTSISSDIQAFDYVEKHLLDQNEQALGTAGDCFYHDGNHACAIGCLISKSNYHDDIEFRGLDGVIIDALEKSNPDWDISNGQTLAMLFCLQYVHDNRTPYTWEHDFACLRGHLFDDDNNLKSNVPYYSNDHAYEAKVYVRDIFFVGY